MQVQLVSDTHAEFGTSAMKFIRPAADTLLWLGDISSKSAASFAEDVEQVAKEFKNVIIVLGNHDFYGHQFSDRVASLKQLMPKNVHLLHRDSVKIDGYTFVGVVLWSDVNKGSPVTANSVQRNISDFYKIKTSDTIKFTVDDMIKEHDKDIAYIKHVVQNMKDELDKVVILSHFMPSMICVDPKWRGQELNYYFACSDLDDFLLDHDLPWWFFGHSHSCTDVILNNTRMVSNCLGYPHEFNQQSNYNESCVFNLSVGGGI